MKYLCYFICQIQDMNTLLSRHNAWLKSQDISALSCKRSAMSLNLHGKTDQGQYSLCHLQAFKLCIEDFVERYRNKGIDVVAGRLFTPSLMFCIFLKRWTSLYKLCKLHALKEKFAYLEYNSSAKTYVLQSKAFMSSSDCCQEMGILMNLGSQALSLDCLSLAIM